MRKLFSLYDKTKKIVNEKSAVLDLEPIPFFKNPNNHSCYNVNIRYGKNSRKIIAASPFSRLGKGIINESDKYIIFTTPKVASTSINKFLHTQVGLGEALERFTEKYHQIKFKYLFDTLPTHGKTQTLYWKDFHEYRKYLVIREPFERIISFYQNKFLRRHDQGNSINRKFGFAYLNTIAHISKDYKTDLFAFTFEGFVNALYDCFKNHNKLWDEHLSLQISSDFKNVALDEVKLYSLENINALFKEIKHDFEVIHENSTHEPKSFFVDGAQKLTMQEIWDLPNRPNKASFFCLELAEKIREIYAFDYEIYMETKQRETMLAK